MSFPKLVRDSDDRVIAGVCGGLARVLGADVSLVRLVFALLAVAGGAGILLYLALWAWTRTSHRSVAGTLLVLAGVVLLHALGLDWVSVAAAGLIAAGVMIVWRQRAQEPGGDVSPIGVGLAIAGGVCLLTGGGTSAAFDAPGAIAAALALVLGPWLWRLARERDAERTARIRTEERADVTARVHDSVLQTLALVQRHADDPRRVASLARRQERELRSWLYGGGTVAPGDTLVGALAAAAAEIEELHGVRVELASGGNTALTDTLQPIVLAAREAMTNAAKFAGTDEVDVYAEADAVRASVYIRDRGAGFDPEAVPDERHGLSDSIRARMARAGGTATVTSAPGEGTEIELTLPLEGS